MSRFGKFIADFGKDQSGASAAEYALILAIVTTGIAGAVIFLGDEVNEAIDRAASCLEATNDDPTTASALCDAGGGGS